MSLYLRSRMREVSFISCVNALATGRLYNCFHSPDDSCYAGSFSPPARDYSATVLVAPRVFVDRWLSKSYNGELDESLALREIDTAVSGIIETDSELPA